MLHRRILKRLLILLRYHVLGIALVMLLNLAMLHLLRLISLVNIVRRWLMILNVGWNLVAWWHLLASHDVWIRRIIGLVLVL